MGNLQCCAGRSKELKTYQTHNEDIFGAGDSFNSYISKATSSGSDFYENVSRDSTFKYNFYMDYLRDPNLFDQISDTEITEELLLTRVNNYKNQILAYEEERILNLFELKRNPLKIFAPVGYVFITTHGLYYYAGKYKERRISLNNIKGIVVGTNDTIFIIYYKTKLWNHLHIKDENTILSIFRTELEAPNEFVEYMKKVWQSKFKLNLSVKLLSSLEVDLDEYCEEKNRKHLEKFQFHKQNLFHAVEVNDFIITIYKVKRESRNEYLCTRYLAISTLQTIIYSQAQRAIKEKISISEIKKLQISETRDKLIVITMDGSFLFHTKSCEEIAILLKKLTHQLNPQSDILIDIISEEPKFPQNILFQNY